MNVGVLGMGTRRVPRRVRKGRRYDELAEHADVHVTVVVLGVARRGVNQTTSL